MPKTNVERQQLFRQNKKISETLNSKLARKKNDAERSKRYRDRIKLKKQHVELAYLLSSKEHLPSSVLLENKKTCNHSYDTNCDKSTFSQFQTQTNQINPSINNEAQQVESQYFQSFQTPCEQLDECSMPNTLLHTKTNIISNGNLNDEATDVICDSCTDKIFGFRYACVQCISFNLCLHCEALRQHADHYMLRMPIGECNTEMEQILHRIRANLKNIIQPKDEPDDNIEESYIITDALEIKQDPLPYLCPAEDTGTMMVRDPVPAPLLLKTKRIDIRTVLKRKEEMKEDKTEFQPKAMRTSHAAVDESIADITAYSDNTKIKIEINEEPIDTEHDNSSASSSVAAASS